MTHAPSNPALLPADYQVAIDDLLEFIEDMHEHLPHDYDFQVGRHLLKKYKSYRTPQEQPND